VRLISPRRERRCLPGARPIVEVEVHKIKVPLQFPDYRENLWIVIAVHLHRDLRNRREQLLGRREKRVPFCAFDVHFDEQVPFGVTVFSDLVLQRVEEMLSPVAGPIPDAFVVKHERAAVAGRTRGIKTVVLIHRNVIPTRHLASPIVVRANAVRIGCIERRGTRRLQSLGRQPLRQR